MNMTFSKRHLITRELAAVAMGTLPADLILKTETWWMSASAG